MVKTLNNTVSTEIRPLMYAIIGKVPKKADAETEQAERSFSGINAKIFENGSLKNAMEYTAPKESRVPYANKLSGNIVITTINAVDIELRKSYFKPVDTEKPSIAHIITALKEETEKPQNPLAMLKRET